MLKIRRPLGRLIFNMGIAIPGKTVFLIETAPWRQIKRCLGEHFISQISSSVWNSKYLYNLDISGFLFISFVVFWWNNHYKDCVSCWKVFFTQQKYTEMRYQMSDIIRRFLWHVISHPWSKVRRQMNVKIPFYDYLITNSLPNIPLGLA